MQKADPSDPWLQSAWAQVLQAESRDQEALAHLRAAAMLFQDAARRLLGAEPGAGDDEPLPLGRDGEPLRPGGAVGQLAAAHVQLEQGMKAVGYGQQTRCQVLGYGLRALQDLQPLAGAQPALARLLEAKVLEMHMAMDGLGGCAASEPAQPADAGAAAQGRAAAHDEL